MEVNNISKEVKKSMKVRIVTAIIMLIILVPCVILGGWFFVGFIGLATVIATYEFMNATKKKYPLPVYILEFTMMISFVFWIFVKENPFSNQAIVTIDYSSWFSNIDMIDISVSTLGLAFFVAMLFLCVITYKSFDVHDACYLFTMSIFTSISFQSALFLRNCPEALYNFAIIGENETVFKYSNPLSESLLLVYSVGCALLCDVYAYFVGVLFGKHKMNPRISPKKTWEGFVGGIVLASLTGVAFIMICDSLGAPVLKGVLDTEHWYWSALFSIIISVISVLGDLMFSSIKRYFNIKDFGSLLPGHGGVLDRFDSVLISCLIVSSLILFIVYTPLSALVF